MYLQNKRLSRNKLRPGVWTDLCVRLQTVLGLEPVDCVGGFLSEVAVHAPARQLIAAKQQEILEKPAVARTWITGYDTPHWAPSFVYGTAELKAQIAGLEDAGLDGGFIPWNAVSSIEKYTEYQDVWNEEQ